MKLMILECNEEELRANRTIMDNITDVMSRFTENLAGVSIKKEAVEAYFENGEANPEDE